MTLEDDLKKIKRLSGAVALDSLNIFLEGLRSEVHPALKDVYYDALMDFVLNQEEHGIHYPSLKKEVKSLYPIHNTGSE